MQAFKTKFGQGPHVETGPAEGDTTNRAHVQIYNTGFGLEPQQGGGSDFF